MIPLINRIKKKQTPHDHPNRCRKAFNKIQHSFMISNTQQSRNRRRFSQTDKGHLKQPQLTSYLIRND